MQMLVQRIDCGRNSNGHKNRVVPSSCSLHYNNCLLGTCPHYYRLRARILRFLVQKKARSSSKGFVLISNSYDIRNEEFRNIQYLNKIFFY